MSNASVPARAAVELMLSNVPLVVAVSIEVEESCKRVPPEAITDVV